MSTKKQNIDLSAYDGRIINTDAFLKDRIASALENSRTRTSPYAKPSWWNDDNLWLDCISTATSNYGDASTVTGNATFYGNPQKYGFRRLNDDEASIPGDIAQSYYIQAGGKANLPDHGYIVNEVDEKGGIKSVNYSDGGHLGRSGKYHVGSTNHWADHEDKDDEGNLLGNYKQYRYRYIGTPAELQAINEHNAAVKAKNIEVYGNENGPQPQSRVSSLKTKPLYSEHPADLRKLNIFQLAELAK